MSFDDVYVTQMLQYMTDSINIDFIRSKFNFNKDDSLPSLY